MNGVLRGDLDEREPTHRAGPCIEDLGLVDEYSLVELASRVVDKEYDYIDVLIHREEDLEVWILVRVMDGDCMRLIQASVGGCGGRAGRLLELADEPEVEKVELVKKGGVECVVLHSSSDPPLRVKRLLDKLGMRRPFKVLGYRPAGDVGVA